MAKSLQPRYLNKDALLLKRAEAGLTQAGLAERAGTVQAAVSQWERGQNGCGIEMLHKLAAALDSELRARGLPGCKPADLMVARITEGGAKPEPAAAA